MGPESISVTLPVIMIGGNISGIAVSPFASVIGTITAHGQDVQISEPYVDTINKSLSMMVSAPDGGQVTLSIPRTMFDLIGEDQRQQPQNDSKFELLIDGKPTTYNQESTLASIQVYKEKAIWKFHFMFPQIPGQYKLLAQAHITYTYTIAKPHTSLPLHRTLNERGG